MGRFSLYRAESRSSLGRLGFRADALKLKVV